MNSVKSTPISCHLTPPIAFVNAVPTFVISVPKVIPADSKLKFLKKLFMPVAIALPKFVASQLIAKTLIPFTAEVSAFPIVAPNEPKTPGVKTLFTKSAKRVAIETTEPCMIFQSNPLSVSEIVFWICVPKLRASSLLAKVLSALNILFIPFDNVSAISFQSIVSTPRLIKSAKKLPTSLGSILVTNAFAKVKTVFIASPIVLPIACARWLLPSESVDNNPLINVAKDLPNLPA